MKHLAIAILAACSLTAVHANERAHAASKGCETVQSAASAAAGAQMQRNAPILPQAPTGLVIHRGGSVVHNTGQVTHRGGNVIHNTGQVAHNTPLLTRPAPIIYGAPSMPQPCTSGG